MPRKTQFTVEDVIKAAFELVREKGLAGLSAPAVAAKMGCSTMPIYSHFKNMQALEDEVVKKAWKMVMQYEGERHIGDAWVDQAVGYVRFARDEHNLFHCRLEGRNLELRFEMLMKNWQYLAKLLKNYDAFDGLDEKLSEKVRYARAMLSHGIAMSPRLGLNKIIVDDDEILSGFLADISHALLTGYKESPPLDEKYSWKEKLVKLIEISNNNNR
ncbi:TetR/AcrR family transcriptional regulator [Desulfococcaceae bacterium HSG7]|nr:TetR/AcrR family transcriptional regulator [Desulfococcaceae bacterium HSG7]